MTTDTDQEKRKLDTWIAEHVFGAHIYTSGRGSVMAMFNRDKPDEYERTVDARHPWDSNDFNPTEDAIDAMAVLVKCAERRDITIRQRNKEHWAVMDDYGRYSESETLPLSICLFAKKLFS